MELTKAQRALLTMPSRWPPIMLGIVLSLFISAIFTFNFATRVMPVSEATSPTSSSLRAPSPTSTITAFSSQLFFFLFRSSLYPRAGGPLHGGNRNNLSTPLEVSSSPLNGETGSVSSSPFKQISMENNGETDSIKDVHHNDSSASQDGAMPPSDDSVDVKSLLGRKVSVNLAPQSSNISTYSSISNVGFENASAGSNGTRITASSSSEQHRERVINKTVFDGPPSSPVVGDRKPSLEKKENKVFLRMEEEPSSLNDANPPCDISIGKWIEDDQYPLYRPDMCPFVDEGFSCQRNGRPDSKYNRWRWAPRDCNVPRFNGTDLLERLRGKRLVFVGDSLNRNQWESMLCMLRESLPDKHRVVQIHGGRISKLPGAYVFKFLDYECRVEFYTSHYLVDKEGLNETDFKVRLDRMDKSERRWRKASVLVFNTGHWWTPDKIGDGDNCFQEGTTVYEKMNVSVAYGKALSTWAKWVHTYVNPQNTTVFFRGYSPVHYIGGQWNSGGQCQDETEPIFDESFLTPYPSKMQAIDAILQEVKLPVQVLNITRLSDFRKDAHPATYGHAPYRVVHHQDCSHWCLPGLPDTWNELLYFALINRSVLASP